MTWPRAVTATFLALGLFVGATLAVPLRAPAQDTTPAAPAQDTTPAAPAQDTTPAAPSRTERPPAGTWRRGIVPLPAIAVLAAGALVVIAAGVVLAQRARKRRR